MRPISRFDKYLSKVICANFGDFLQKLMNIQNAKTADYGLYQMCRYKGSGYTCTFICLFQSISSWTSKNFCRLVSKFESVLPANL